MTEDRNRTLLLACGVIAVVVSLCCICIAILMVIGSVVNLQNYSLEDGGIFTSQGPPTQTPVVIRPTTPAKPGGKPDQEFHSETVFSPADTLQVLENTEIPINDRVDLVQRLEGIQNIPPTLPPPPAPLQIGTQETFWVSNVDDNRHFQISATLRYVTDHSYFWIEDGVTYEEIALQELAEAFEDKIYPNNRAFFGSEWSPGIDGDPHLYILFARGLGDSIAGYFSSADEYHPLAHEFSNAHEMFYFNADSVSLDERFTFGVLAHEFQHMIHWYRDRNEQTWLNEGFSELASFLNGYETGGADFLYSKQPDLQLNTWPNNPNQTTPHYGASFLFVTYFLNRFGEEATQALIAHPSNGLSSIDAVLKDIDTRDPTTGDPISADDFFIDWLIATYLQDETIADGRYAYANYPEAPRLANTETMRTCPFQTRTRDVRQYGADFIRFSCVGDYTLDFEGTIQVGVIPADPYSGSYAFWSNKGDESDMTLTRRFDFTNVSGPLTLNYWTWFDLEEDYDYVHLESSLDGKQWQILNTPSGTAENPSGNSFGWGYNGISGGGPAWIQETVDLSQFAGQQVHIRFEYITDAAVNGEGLMVDDISIPETGYFTDFETDGGGWEAKGFVRIQNLLPQTFRLALITMGENPTVQMIPLSAENAAQIPIRVGGDIEQAILVVAGTTRFTRQSAAYRFTIER